MEVSDTLQQLITPEQAHISVNEIFELLQEEPNEIRFIRKNLRPLFIEQGITSKTEKAYELLERHTRVPSWIISELINHLQLIGYFGSPSLRIANDALGSKTEEEVMDIAMGIFDTLSMDVQFCDEDISKVLSFLSELANTGLVHAIRNRSLTRENLPWGVFRGTSLFDMNYSQFSSLSKYLEFLNINIQEQELLFNDHYIDMICENGGLPVDDIKEKETTMLSLNTYVSSVGNIEFNNKQYEIFLRVIPGFSPVGVSFALSINLEDENGEKTNQNYFSFVGAQFEKQIWNGEECIVPVIHTIQSSTHNIGINQRGDLAFVREPFIPAGVTLLPTSGRMALYASCMELFAHQDDLKNIMGQLLESHGKNHIKDISGVTVKSDKVQSVSKAAQAFVARNYSPTTTLSGFVSLYFLEKGYNHVQIINANENQRLMQHNQDREKSSVKKSGQNMYAKMSKILGGKLLDNGRHSILPSGFVKQFINRDPLSLSFLNIDKLVAASQQWENNTNGGVGGVSSLSEKNDRLLEAYISLQK